MTPEDEAALKKLSLENAEHVARLSGQQEALIMFVGYYIQMGRDAGVDPAPLIEKLRAAFNRGVPPGPAGKAAWDGMNHTIDTLDRIAKASK